MVFSASRHWSSTRPRHPASLAAVAGRREVHGARCPDRVRAPGSYDRPGEAAGLHRAVGIALGGEVRPAWDRGVGLLRVYRGDDQEAVDAELLRGLDALQRAAEVDVCLRSGPLPGPAPAAKTIASAAPTCGRRSSLLEVAEHGEGAVGLEVGDVVGVADQPARRVAVAGRAVLGGDGRSARALRRRGRPFFEATRRAVGLHPRDRGQHHHAARDLARDEGLIVHAPGDQRRRARARASPPPRRAPPEGGAAR